MVSVDNFQEALVQTSNHKRHLLLGNGFSIALFPDRFRYGALLEEADFSQSPEARAAFEALGTSDFEVVIEAMRRATALIQVYAGDAALAERLFADSETLKELLVQAIAGLHPARPSEISEVQFRACRAFLAAFVGESRDLRPGGGKDLRGQIYTLNYDLLLYWALMHTDAMEIDSETLLLRAPLSTEGILHDDGFREPDTVEDAPYVTWDAEDAANNQNIHFLHGGLHLFDYGAELQKKCWERSGGLALVDQIRTALEDGKFPLFVSEGASETKLDRIRHSGYLQRSLRSFAGICRTRDASLFVFGHSLAENDEHILRQIEKGRIAKLFISLFGSPSTAANSAIISRAQRLALARNSRYPVEIQYFDAESAGVWAPN